MAVAGEPRVRRAVTTAQREGSEFGRDYGARGLPSSWIASQPAPRGVCRAIGATTSAARTHDDFPLALTATPKSQTVSLQMASQSW